MSVSLADPLVRQRAAEAVERVGWQAVTLEQLARALGVSRVTLHRQGIGKAEVLEALRDHIAALYREALWPALTSPGNARERFEQACEALCDLSERHLRLLEGLSDVDRAVVFHDPGENALTRAEITAGLIRLLRDGVAERTLQVGDSPEETATVVFNLIGGTYRHLRAGHGWPPERARRAVVEIAVRGVSA